MTTREQLKDREQNIVKVGIHLEGDWREKEYQIRIMSFCGALLIDVPGGHDDPYLIGNAIEEDAENVFQDLEEGYIEVWMIESGEWQDQAWCKWYEITKVLRHSYQ